ncbi:MAG: 50S ribosomal protein L6 [Patescibacteria group bacterium]
MSRIGKKPINIPEKVSVEIAPNQIKIKGPKGELTQFIHPDIMVKQVDNELIVDANNKDIKQGRALWGTFASIINNMVIGVTQGFSKSLEINGVGFGWEMQGNKLNLKVGFSHPVVFEMPKGIEGKTDKNTLTITGIDKQLVGAIAAEIRKIKKPEPYKGKGIKYSDEIIRRKAGKQASSAS